ncbi:MAG: serine/threonine protein kinase [Myxococcota bacterium]|nr:serine/threonine protein kinase [Myxococcota bacterium]MDW8362475.1 serine/threonine-protein kinase [Myxococcales bacterium]
MRKTKRVGRYHLLERIAYGGMAEIFRGFTYEDEQFRRDVAIKKLLPHFVEDKQFIDMLTDEFKLVSHLKHPNIAEVYELARIDGELLIVMEYVDGKDLRSTVEKARLQGVPLALDDIAFVMARALDGLHHAHVARDARGEPLRIVHRDFSPSNVLVAYDGTVKICDFGIAKATHSRVQTKTGIIKGKVKYMSPEQAFGRKLDWRSDIFSAGSVLYELATGAAPFQAANEVDLIFAVRDAAPRPAREVNPAIPPRLAAIIEKAMARSRSARFQTAKDFRDALIEFIREHNPAYRRTRLARFMKRVWAVEIENELRALENVVLDEAPRRDYGQNLIADALGPDAAFSRFSPNPTRSTGRQTEVGADVHEARTELVEPRVSRTSSGRTASERHGARRTLPLHAPAELHDEKTLVVPPRER